MDPLERLRSHLVGVTCAACGRPYRPDRIRLLAERDDLTFIELHCERCGTDAVGLLGVDPVLDDVALPPPTGGVFDHEPGALFGEFSPADVSRFREAPLLSADDQLDLHDFLADYAGDLRTLLGGRSA